MNVNHLETSSKRTRKAQVDVVHTQKNAPFQKKILNKNRFFAVVIQDFFILNVFPCTFIV